MPRPYSLDDGDFDRSTINQLQFHQVHFVKPIGEGHSSKVHLAILRRQSNSSGSDEEQYVAVKTVTNSDFDSEDIMREIRLIAKCTHSNIVEYVGHYRTGFGIHIVTEFMAGGDLHKFLLDENNVREGAVHFGFKMDSCTDTEPPLSEADDRERILRHLAGVRGDELPHPHAYSPS